jgi:hypothetical protein
MSGQNFYVKPCGYRNQKTVIHVINFKKRQTPKFTLSLLNTATFISIFNYILYIYTSLCCTFVSVQLATQIYVTKLLCTFSS